MLLTPGKIVLYSTYIFIGAYLTFWLPGKNIQSLFGNVVTIRHAQPPIRIQATYWLAGLIGVASLTLIPWWYVSISLFIAVAIQYKNKLHEKYAGSCIFISLIFASFLPWWLHNSKNRLEISPAQTIIFLAITTVTYLLLVNSQKLTQISTNWVYRLIDISFGAALLAAYSTSISVSISTADFAQWHHWGAYIGPAELIFNGVFPLYDIPIQYGLGPSLVIASGCRWGCWSSLFWIVTICNLIFAFTLARISIYLYKPRNWIERILILLVILLLCIFWLSLPISLQAPNAFPSGNSLRFLPGLLMLYLLVLNPPSSGANQNIHLVSRYKNLSVYALWILSFAWSPEAGIHTTCLLGPYVLWHKLSQANQANYLACALMTLCKLAGALLMGILSLSSIFYISLGVWPKVSLYLTYILNPINPSPVNPNGPIWVIVLTILMFYSWQRRLAFQNSTALFTQPLTRNAWLVALLCFANFSYCLGRSSDGNLIAMLPYFILIILIVQRWSEPGPNKIFSTILLASIIGWAAIPTHIHNYAIAFSRDDLISIDASRIANAFDRSNPQSVFFIKFDKPMERQKLESAQSAITYLRTHSGEPIETFDRYSLIDAKDGSPPWNALYGPANFTEIPSSLRRIYLRNVAKRLARPGWVLFDKDYQEMDRYLQDYDSAYQRTEIIDFGYYTAIRYSPKE